jgi:hypothetical protein
MAYYCNTSRCYLQKIETRLLVMYFLFPDEVVIALRNFSRIHWHSFDPSQ